MTTDPITTGSTIDFPFVATKGGAAFDITGAAVTVYFTSPTGVRDAGHAAQLTSPTTGQATYTTATTDLTVTGTWYQQWKVVKGGTTIWYRRTPFEVLQGG